MRLLFAAPLTVVFAAAGPTPFGRPVTGMEVVCRINSEYGEGPGGTRSLVRARHYFFL